MEGRRGLIEHLLQKAVEAAAGAAVHMQTSSEHLEFSCIAEHEALLCKAGAALQNRNGSETSRTGVPHPSDSDPTEAVQGLRDDGPCFRPELLNRMDGIIAFKPLTKPDAREYHGRGTQ